MLGAERKTAEGEAMACWARKAMVFSEYQYWLKSAFSLLRMMKPLAFLSIFELWGSPEFNSSMNPCSTAKPLLQQDSNIKLYYIDCRPRKDSQLCTHPGAQGRKFENMKQLTKNMNCIMQNYYANQESLPKVNTAQGLSPTPSITGIFRSKRLLVTSNCLQPTKVKQMKGYL